MVHPKHFAGNNTKLANDYFFLFCAVIKIFFTGIICRRFSKRKFLFFFFLALIIYLFYFIIIPENQVVIQRRKYQKNEPILEYVSAQDIDSMKSGDNYIWRIGRG